MTKAKKKKIPSGILSDLFPSKIPHKLHNALFGRKKKKKSILSVG